MRRSRLTSKRATDMPWIEPLTRRAAWITIAAVVVAFLSLASHFVIPLALAILLAFLLSPLVRRLSKVLHSRALAVMVTCTFAFAVIAAGSLAVVYQMADFANELPNYRHTISKKIVALREASSGPVSRLMGALTDIKHDVEAASTQPSSPSEKAALNIPLIRVVNTSPDETTALASLAAAGAVLLPFIEPVVMFAIVSVLVVFLLIYTEDLRDRVIVLAGAQQISVTTQALEAAAKRIGHYLLMQAMVNTGYGAAVAIGLWFIGVPNAFLLGLLAGILRFIPVIGVWIGAILPLLVSVAVFDQWLPVIEVGVLFVVLEAIANFAIEPMLYGSGTGISGIAVLVAILFWTWIWGAVGLLLAVPITVCLVTLGKYVEPLRSFYVMLSDEPVLAGERRLYHRLMTGDFTSAEAIVAEATNQIGDTRVTDELLLPVLQTARVDHERGALSDERYTFIKDTITGLSAEIADPTIGAGPIACVGVEPADAAANELVCMTISRATGEHVHSFSNALTTDIVKRVKEDGISTLILASTSRESVGRARLLNKALRTRLSGVTLYIADLSGNTAAPTQPPTDGLILSTVAAIVDRMQQAQRSQLNVTAAATSSTPTAA